MKPAPRDDPHMGLSHAAQKKNSNIGLAVRGNYRKVDQRVNDVSESSPKLLLLGGGGGSRPKRGLSRQRQTWHTQHTWDDHTILGIHQRPPWEPIQKFAMQLPGQDLG